MKFRFKAIWLPLLLGAALPLKSIHAASGGPPAGNASAPRSATAAESLTLPPGFKVELLRSALPEEGSWSAMTLDPKGRLIISAERGTNTVRRFTLGADGQVAKVELIALPVGSAQGLLCAFDSLYLNGAGPQGLGLYRLTASKHDDQYDTITQIYGLQNANGEHGSHAVVLGPDQHLYIVSGNFTKLPAQLSPRTEHKNYADDQLLPRAPDGNGFGSNVKPPGGFLLRTDRDGKEWELFAAGMRNTYGFTFNSDGEMIGFDSDMQWDWGAPWYRPCWIFHLVSGGEYGFREGTGKWPSYYPDSLPPTVEVGIGSPTGMKFATDSKFPPAYKHALFAADWAYGRIFAVHMKPQGASYSATWETFLKGRPLNVTALEFARDGAMYFITGGRGTQSGLYRVSYVGPQVSETPPTAAELRQRADGARARAIRHQLEAFHGQANPQALDFLWPYLNHEDRFLRYAARIALESQPVAQWQDRALSETRTNAALTALLALARCGEKSLQPRLLTALGRFPLAALDEPRQLEKLRILELSFIRQGRPAPADVQPALAELDRSYPANSEWLNRELSELLIYLQAPGVVTKTLGLVAAARTQEEQVHYILHLRTLTNGWTLDQRKQYFNWFTAHEQHNLPTAPVDQGGINSGWPALDATSHPAKMLQWFKDADRDYTDGASFPKFLAGFRKDAMDSLNAQESAELTPLLNAQLANAPILPTPPRRLVKEWKMADLEPLLEQAGHGRNFTRGREVFTTAQCITCHQMAGFGGAVGPELTAISSRYSRHDILESILLPSKVVSDQYQNTTFIRKDGEDITGRIAEEDDRKVVLITNPLLPARTEIPKSGIQSRVASKVSPMPEGLANTLTQDDLLDLIAYLEAGGKPGAAAFAR